MKIGLMYVLIGLASICGLGVAYSKTPSSAPQPARAVSEVARGIDPVPPQPTKTGYVDDQAGKPIPNAQIEVYQPISHTNRKLETVIKADAIGRFTVPEALWNDNPRLLLVRSGNAIGWSSQIAYYQKPAKDIRITLLPLKAIIRGKLVDQQ